MISRRIFAALALLCAFVAPAHAQKTKAAIITEIPQLCPPNQFSGLCTVPNANQLWSDIVNSIMPTAPVVSGNLACFNGTTGLLQDCGSSPINVGLVVGTSAITNGTPTRVLFDNAGVLGEYVISGSGSVCMTISCIMTTPNIGAAIGSSLALGGATIGSSSLAVAGSSLFSGAAIYTGTSAPSSAAGNTAVLGTIAVPTLTNTAQGFFYNTAAGGALVQGDGSTYDVTVANKSGLTVFGVPTGTTKLQLPALASGTCVSGLGLDSGNNTILTACAGASASIQIGGTTVTSSTNHSVLTTGTGTLNQAGPGTAGQALVSNGASADPSFQSGTWVLLNTLTASNSATLSDTTHITSTYNDYKLVFENLLPATASTNCEIQVHSNGSFQTTGYGASAMRYASTASAVTSSTTFIPCDQNAAGAITTGGGTSGEITLYSASQTSSHKIWQGAFGEDLATFTGVVVSGVWSGGNTAIDGFQVLYSSGNAASGTVKLYGRL